LSLPAFMVMAVAVDMQLLLDMELWRAGILPQTRAGKDTRPGGFGESSPLSPGPDLRVVRPDPGTYSGPSVLLNHGVL
jgi:hypothetical protein